MRSIREAAMSKEEPETPKYSSPYPSQSSFDNFDDEEWQKDIDEMFPKSNYSPQDPNAIFITFKLQYTEIGPESDPDNDLWDENIAETKAIEIAYDKVEKMLGKGFESKYTVCFKATDNYDEYDLEVELTPTN